MIYKVKTEYMAEDMLVRTYEPEKMVIRQAEAGEGERVFEFYYLLIDDMQNAEFRLAWEKDIYPSQRFIIDSINNGELYVGEINGEFAAAMVMNHECTDGYDSVKWHVDAKESEVSVIYALGVRGKYQGQGLAARMVNEARVIAKSQGQKAIRLDVLKPNVPAHKLYIAMGFKYVDEVKLFYEDTGLTDFVLYELVL